MRVSGASKLYLTTQSTDLQLKVSGASKVTASGSSESLSVDASGASEVNASKVLVDKAALKASGASDIKVHAKELISSKSTGASDIENLE
ncbi:MAG: DUF2807 domain-containing protein [Candidatus Peribacteria bacterium]|jgi:hypothetical protein|nr:DUF2807 domain-containing protein [Candidatus Peribacteria bacterium]